ncbi:asparaginase like 1 [Aspergillus brunneoviolaceus CBS 621.78]|uniref:Asparaginase like 1 n=1 Tax=Aspergillus brunneoviolaceus CBS 621.78 TaxID=1450534 RepID=A0ACD1G5A3_9EURO|nr:asparaginase like 1 [Aspergillus brunneoviolaceus CBS 621.78]RAH44417.1 asparaginase like 1 [Aspergillus brunneoviolaceus CBS 621.78]
MESFSIHSIQSNLLPMPHHQALERLYYASRKPKLSAPRLWRHPSSYAVQALRSPWHRTLLRLQSAVFHTSIEFFPHTMGYEYLVVPVTTGSVSSPMGLGSDSQPVTIWLDDQATYLADSQQFLLEYALRLQDRPHGVYYAGTSCRGEDPDATHLNQFFHVECELVGDLAQALLASHGAEIARCAGTTAHLQQLLRLFRTNNHSFPRITLAEAMALPELTDGMWSFVVPGDPAFGRALTRKGEQILIARFGGACWLTEMDHPSVPFYQAYVPDIVPPGGVAKAQCADFLLGMGEVLGCGNRHVTVNQALRALGNHGVAAGDYQWYLDMRREMEVNTTGWGIGTERFLCWVLGHGDVRDVQMFLRLKGMDSMP